MSELPSTELAAEGATFVALAEQFDTTFVTADERLVRQLASSPHVRFLGGMQNV